MGTTGGVRVTGQGGTFTIHARTDGYPDNLGQEVVDAAKSSKYNRKKMFFALEEHSPDVGEHGAFWGEYTYSVDLGKKSIKVEHRNKVIYDGPVDGYDAETIMDGDH